MKLFRRHPRLPLVFQAFTLLAIFSIVTASVGKPAAQAAGGRDPIFGAPLKGVPAWLAMAGASNQLYSEYDLAGLAGRLINHNLVDASDCPGLGLQDQTTANPCGIERAAPAMYEWQNRFNTSILETSQTTGVPPILLKNIFAWESQFWPNTVFVNTYEYGLGHMTHMGADSTLRWNAPFYDSVCAGNFSDETCEENYYDQPAEIRAALQGVLIQRVNADCANCANGLDLPLAERSISVFANTLLANASFVKYYVKQSTGRPAADVVSYEDLWKFTLVSYNAGPGCFQNAFQNTRRASRGLNWENVSSQLALGCQGSLPYIKFISKTNRYFPDRDPGLATPLPIENPLPTGTQAGIVTAASPTLDAASATTSVTVTSSSVTPTATSPMDGTTTDASLVVTAMSSTLVSASVTPTAKSQAEITVTASGPALTETPSPVSTLTVESATSTAIPAATVSTVEAQTDAPHVQDEIVLKIDPANEGTILETLKDLGIDLTQDSQEIGSLDTLVVQVDADEFDRVLASLQQSGAAIAEPNYLARMSSLPNDPELYQQTSLWTMQVPQAWDAISSSQEVLVAVIDTGVDFTHPDLTDVIWQNPGEINGNSLDDDNNGYVDDWQGWNMAAGNSNAADDQGHGTHIAGIIGASVNNSTGMAGIAPNARILPVKVLDNIGFGTYAQVAEGIVYATDMGARIINLGFGGTGSSELLQNAVDYATAHGALVIASSGNGGNSTTYYPAGYSGVIAVAAADNDLSWSPFSSSGGHIGLVAPGAGVFSTFRGSSYSTMSGTSMSAAQVSGVAALLAGQPQFADVNVLRSALLNTALDLGTAGHDPYYGYGMVRAYDALAYAGTTLPVPTPWTVPTSTPGGPGGVWVMASNDLWAVNTQTYPAGFTLTNAPGSIDGAFNDNAANLAGALAASTTNRWSFTNFNDTTLPGVAQALLDVRFYADPATYVDDGYRIEIRQGSFWVIVALLRPGGGSYQPVPTAMTTMTFDVSSIINTVAYANGAQVRISGDITGANGVAETVTMYVDGIRLRVWDVLPPPTPTPLFMPTSTLAARALTATPGAGEPHNSFNATTDTCSACHRSHRAQGSTILRTTPSEESVCFVCHTSGGSGTNVQPAFTSKTNTLTRFFSHSIFSTQDIHQTAETTGSNFGGANRHVECEDCHAPHNSSRVAALGSNTAPLVQQEMYHSSGVDPVWTAAGVPASFNWLTKADREYQVCLKCHSSFTTTPSYVADGYGWDGSDENPGYISNGLGKLDNSSGAQIPDSRDLATEFNTYQASYHPVAGAGRNTNMPPGSFVAGWSQNSILYCADCHENSNAPTNGNGPHGSALLHILKGSDEYVTKIDPATACTLSPDGCPFVHTPGELCFQCHQYNTYATGTNPSTSTFFRKSTQNLHSVHSMAACYTCHDSHGSEQLHLINFDTSVVTILPGYNSQSAWSSNGTQGTCYVACHSSTHGAQGRFQYIP